MSVQNSEFILSFSVDTEGIISVYVVWPEENRIELKSKIVDTLCAISSGDMKKLTAEAITNSASENPQIKDYIASIIVAWSKKHRDSSATPIIKPSNAFMK
tara:strand:- start:58 stop:360 length:303 start_codon:yes stop_codon:yes gene_type:complete